jgi:patatin-related protein
MAAGAPDARDEAAGVPEPGATKELRLAVVCYGGVSLAIYMHGQTKEINRLVRASRLLDLAGPEARGWGSEGVYVELLRELAAAHPERVRTRVVVDTVAGTSAGGINGVYLAKAVAHNRSQDALRNLWLERGDMSILVRGPKRLPWWLRAAAPLVRVRTQAPLHGDLMSLWIYEALEDMDAQARAAGEPETLMPEQQLLQLFVTMTDFNGYAREVVLMDPEPDPENPPQPIPDRRHRHVLEFRHDGGRDDFGPPDNPALAFAARSTSSFPGAFQPLSFGELEGYLRGKGVRLDDAFGEKYFRHYGLSAAVPRDAHFIDGGVLDNKPFGHAIGAIRGKRAFTEVDRRLVYLEPNPGTADPLGETEPETTGSPTTASTVLGALSRIPRKEPLLDDLLEVARHNDRVRRVRDVIETSFDRVAERVQETIGTPLTEVPPDLAAETVGGWAAAIHTAAQEDAGFGYATYIRLKIGDVVDRYARAVCAASNFPDDCNQAFFVRTAMRQWAGDGGLFEQEGSPTKEQEQFLREFDLEFRKRRLQFAIAGLNWFYRDRALGLPDYPPRRELDAVKRRLYEGTGRLDEAVAAIRTHPDLSRAVAACFSEGPIHTFVRDEGYNPAMYARVRREALDRLREGLRAFLAEELAGFTPTLYADLDELTRGWHPDRRRDMLVRYLGFPFWDVLLYPLHALAEVGERDHVQVLRMSPRDATLLGEEGEKKLEGVGLHHFGAFFGRHKRENDYLWGRLDGAEQLIGLLVRRDDPEFVTWCRRAFEKILEEEAAANPPLPDEILGRIRERIARLPQQP